MFTPTFARQPLERAVRLAARKTGRRISRDVTIRKERYGIVIEHPLRTALLDQKLAEPVGEAIVDHALEVSALGAHGRAWAKELRRRHMPQDEAPDASYIVHPLALRIAMDDGVPRGCGPSSWARGRPSCGKLLDFHWTENRCGAWIAQRMLTHTANNTLVAYAAIDPDREPRIRIGVSGALVHSAEDVIGGPLCHVLNLPVTGDRQVDAAFAGLTITHADKRPDSMTLTLAPTRWIGWTGNPDWERWHEQNPYIG